MNQNTSGTAANLSGTPALPNGTAATTQSASDNTTKLATTAYADAQAALRGTGNAASAVTTTFSATPTFTCPTSTKGTVTTFTLSTALTANITSSTLASGTTAQLLAHLTKIKGAMAEAEAIGLTGWLKDREKVTRDEVRAYLDAHLPVGRH